MRTGPATPRARTTVGIDRKRDICAIPLGVRIVNGGNGGHGTSFRHGDAETRRWSLAGLRPARDPGTSDKHKVGPSSLALRLPLVPGSSRAQRGATTEIPGCSVSPRLRV